MPDQLRCPACGGTVIVCVSYEEIDLYCDDCALAGFSLEELAQAAYERGRREAWTTVTDNPATLPRAITGLPVFVAAASRRALVVTHWTTRNAWETMGDCALHVWQTGDRWAYWPGEVE